MLSNIMTDDLLYIKGRLSYFKEDRSEFDYSIYTALLHKDITDLFAKQFGITKTTIYNYVDGNLIKPHIKMQERLVNYLFMIVNNELERRGVL